MNHDRLKDLLIEYSENELAAEEKREVAEHLSACASCRAELDSIIGLLDRVKTPTLPDPGESFWNEFTQKVEAGYFGTEEKKVIDLSKQRAGKYSQWFTPTRLAYAAVIAMTIGFTSWVTMNVINKNDLGTVTDLDQYAIMEDAYTSTEVDMPLAEIDEIAADELDDLSESIAIEIEEDELPAFAQGDTDTQSIFSYEESIDDQLAELDAEQLDRLYEQLETLGSSSEAAES